MAKKSGEDPTSLGNILLEWGIITREALERALKEQQTLRGDDLLGRLLVAGGACTEHEINAAMSAQKGLRAAGRHKRAMAVADLAMERHRRKSLLERRQRLVECAQRVERSITGDQPMIVPAMLAKPENS